MFPDTLPRILFHWLNPDRLQAPLLRNSSQLQSTVAHKHGQQCLTDNTRDHILALNMEQCNDTTAGHYVLGFIAGLCNEVLVEDMLMYLREAQDARRQSHKLPD
jgi:hypothetical protein